MSKVKGLSLILVTIAMVWQSPNAAEAGPLLNWLRGKHCCRKPVAAPSYMPCQTTCMQTCHRTVVNYVPVTAYRTCWETVPVTTYRAHTTVDPCTGCTVTCMKPCTTYTYRAKQVPYTTYRPVYTTQAYQVPITYTSQMPAMQSPMVGSGCDTCGIPGFQQPTQFQPGTITAPSITGTLDTQGGYTLAPSTGMTVPADTQPQLNQRPIIIEQTTLPATGSSTRVNPPATQQVWPSDSNLNPIQSPQNGTPGQPPQLFDGDAKTARILESESPAVQRFDYSPIRTASLNTNRTEPDLFGANGQATSQPGIVYTGTVQRQGGSTSTPTPANHGWRSIEN